MSAAAEMRAIPGEDGYLAGSDGHIYSIRAWRGPAGRQLAEGRDYDGYQTVQLAAGPAGARRTSTRAVHRLVGAAFLPPRPPGQELRHFNGDKADNTPGNLRWGTQRDNAADRDRHGRTARGTRNGNRKLDEATVRGIKGRLACGDTQMAIAAAVGVRQGTISAIKRGKLWGWL